jgi:RNA polymerase sigma-70 factor (ECF subfamily)
MTVLPVRLTPETLPVPAKEADDESLASRMKKGDREASEELVRRYATPLLRYLQRLCGEDHAAEELFQQTWLSVLEHVDRFNPDAGGGFKAWVYRIATNKANDRWRSKGREKNAKDGLKLVTDESFPDASVRLDGSEQEARLRQAMAQLPEPQRQVLLLRYYSELKFVEIADMLGCPLNTALGRMHKAMQKLKAMME